MNEPQSRGEQFARTNEPAVEFLLHTVMAPTVLAKLCQLDEGSDLDLKDRKIGTARARVKISLVIGALRRVYILLRRQQLFQQRLRLLQVFRIKTFCEPAVNL
jgi:hypothetical protein